MNGAKWIGSNKKSINGWNADCYEIIGKIKQISDSASVLFGGRDWENYLELSFSAERNTLSLLRHSDLAFEGMTEMRSGKTCQKLGEWSAQLAGGEISFNITVKKTELSVIINGVTVAGGEAILPAPDVNTLPRESKLMLIGVKPEDRAKFAEFSVNARSSRALADEELLPVWDLNSQNACLLGDILIDPMPAVTVGKWVSIRNNTGLKKATLKSSARGFYESYINGKKVGDSFYAPGFTDYRVHIDYQKEDVTELVKTELKDGKVFLSAIVTHGYYSGFCGYSGAENYGRENSYIASLTLEYEDGSVDRVVSDESWGYSACGPVIFADYLDGEYRDGRREAVLLGDGEWLDCGVLEAPGIPVPSNGTFGDNQPEFIFAQQDYEPAKIRQVLPPVGYKEIPDNHRVYDFGQNIVGSVRLKLNAKKGTTIRLRYGEMSYKNGEIYIQNIRTAANNDVYICNGENDFFMPSFTSHGFRYVELTADCSLKDIEITNIEALLINNLEIQTGEFSCSNELLNKLQSNICYSQKDNYLLIPTDCPQRNERMGWTGDAQVFARTAAFNMDVKDFTRKWLRDLREATLMYNREGAIPDTAPLGGDNRPGPCGGWSDAAVIVPWELYLEYGDSEILRENYEMMEGWVNYQMRSDREKDGIQLEKRRGDHLAYDMSTPFELCATAYAAHCADIMSQVAAILGKEDDSEKYKNRFEYIKNAFAREYVGADGDLNQHSQTSYALAVDYELVPVTEALKAGFVKAIRERDTHLSVGFLGIAHLLPALSMIGEDNLAYELLMQESEPGWLYSVLNGATTIWERWNSYIAETGEFGDVNMNSFNHYAYGSVGSWIYEKILGIKRLSPGYKEISIAPTAFDGLSYAKGYHDCGFGRINVAWEIKNGEMDISYSVPTGCTVV